MCACACSRAKRAAHGVVVSGVYIYVHVCCAQMYGLRVRPKSQFFCKSTAYSSVSTITRAVWCLGGILWVIVRISFVNLPNKECGSGTSLFISVACFCFFWHFAGIHIVYVHGAAVELRCSSVSRAFVFLSARLPVHFGNHELTGTKTKKKSSVSLR